MKPCNQLELLFQMMFTAATLPLSKLCRALSECRFLLLETLADVVQHVWQEHIPETDCLTDGDGNVRVLRTSGVRVIPVRYGSTLLRS